MHPGRFDRPGRQRSGRTKGEPALEASPELPGRGAGEEAYSEAELLELVRRLLELRRDTDPADPAGGAATERLKDRRAAEALSKLGKLVQELGLWAIHHEAGRRLAGLEPMTFWSDSEPEHNAATNSHVHERRAAAARREDYQPEAARAALADVLRMILPPEWPPAGELVKALEAMNQGQINPLLSPQRSRGMRPQAAELAKLRAKAVAHAHFLHNEGKTMRDAAAIVAKAYRFGGDNPGKTIRDHWKSEAERSPNNRAQFQAALNLGRPQRPATGDWLEDRIEAERPKVGRSLYGGEALERDGKRYHELMLDVEKAKPKRR